MSDLLMHRNKSFERRTLAAVSQELAVARVLVVVGVVVADHSVANVGKCVVNYNCLANAFEKCY